MRQCPFNGCTELIDPGKFACRRHWFTLPPDQRGEIWDCYRKWLRGAISGDELRRRQQSVLDRSKIGGRAE